MFSPRQYFVAHKVQPDNLRRERRIVEIAVNRIAHHHSHFFDCFALRGDPVAKRRRDVAAFFGFGNLKDDFGTQTTTVAVAVTSVKGTLPVPAPCCWPADTKARWCSRPITAIFRFYRMPFVSPKGEFPG
jgi:hypothetical protein